MSEVPNMAVNIWTKNKMPTATAIVLLDVPLLR
jgi:hypothetical protein